MPLNNKILFRKKIFYCIPDLPRLIQELITRLIINIVPLTGLF